MTDMTGTPDPVEKNADGSLTYISTDERIRLWNEAVEKAEKSGKTPREEWNTAFLERKRATMGPNPTQEKARKLYEWWLSGCGTYIAGNYTRYDKLDEGQQQRWAMLSKALGDHPYHDHVPGSVEQRAEKYKNIPQGVSWAEFDNALHPEEAGYSDKTDGKGAYIHNDDPTYDEWVELQPLQRQHWWQFWRPVEVFTDYEHYRRFIRDQALLRKGPDEPIGGIIGDILRAASKSSR